MKTQQIHQLQLTIPPKSSYSRLLREVSSGFASTCGISFDNNEDLGLAVSEAFGELLDSGAGASVTLRIETVEERLIIILSHDGPLELGSNPDELRNQILAAVTTDLVRDQGPSTTSITFEVNLHQRSSPE